MTTPDVVLGDLLAEMIGKVCTGVDNPIGSHLLIHIGSVDQLPSSDPRRGWRTVTVLSPWRLSNSAEVICDWTETGGPNGSLIGYMSILKGRTIEAVEAVAPTFDLQVKFGHDIRLQVFSDATNDREDAWRVRNTNGTIVAVAPILDGGGGIRFG